MTRNARKWRQKFSLACPVHIFYLNLAFGFLLSTKGRSVFIHTVDTAMQTVGKTALCIWWTFVSIDAKFFLKICPARPLLTLNTNRTEYYNTNPRKMRPTTRQYRFLYAFFLLRNNILIKLTEVETFMFFFQWFEHLSKLIFSILSLLSYHQIQQNCDFNFASILWYTGFNTMADFRKYKRFNNSCFFGYAFSVSARKRFTSVLFTRARA